MRGRPWLGTSAAMQNGEVATCRSSSARAARGAADFMLVTNYSCFAYEIAPGSAANCVSESTSG